MSVVLDKAKDLAQTIVDSEELAALKEAEVKMGNDAEAVTIVQEFQNVQKSLYEKQSNGVELSSDEKLQVAAIEGKMEKNLNIKAYLDAQLKFENLLQGVNFIISQALSGSNGDGGCDCGSDCGSECDSDCGSGCNCN